MPLSIPMTSTTSIISQAMTARPMATRPPRRSLPGSRASRIWQTNSVAAEAGITAYCHHEGRPSVMLVPDVSEAMPSPAVNSLMIV